MANAEWPSIQSIASGTIFEFSSAFYKTETQQSLEFSGMMNNQIPEKASINHMLLAPEKTLQRVPRVLGNPINEEISIAYTCCGVD